MEELISLNPATGEEVARLPIAGAAAFGHTRREPLGVVAQLEAGTCWINSYNVTPIEPPFGGNKLAGIGRENGRSAIEHYTQLKSIYVAVGDVDAPY